MDNQSFYGNQIPTDYEVRKKPLVTRNRVVILVIVAIVTAAVLAGFASIQPKNKADGMMEKIFSNSSSESVYSVLGDTAKEKNDPSFVERDVSEIRSKFTSYSLDRTFDRFDEGTEETFTEYTYNLLNDKNEIAGSFTVILKTSGTEEVSAYMYRTQSN